MYGSSEPCEDDLEPPEGEVVTAQRSLLHAARVLVAHSRRLHEPLWALQAIDALIQVKSVLYKLSAFEVEVLGRAIKDTLAKIERKKLE